VGARASAQTPDAGVDDPSKPARWFATFSIIAFDPATGDLGVAVQSHAFTAGAAVPYAVAGVGAVATQAAANRLYGPKAIALLKQGLSPAEVVKRLTDEDPGRDTRQLAVIDAKGRSAVYTGKRVIDRNSDPADFIHLGGYAGHITRPAFSVQGNTLASQDVLENMARAYEQGKGTMAERLMDSLDAGQAAGGDTRGMQSAGLLVVRPVPPGSSVVVDRIVDLRVDDAVDPFKELRRLLQINLGVPSKLVGQSAEVAKAGKFDEAIALVKQALEIQPNSDTLHYALAQRYAQAERPLQALVPLREAIRLHPNLARQAAEDPIFTAMRDLAEFKRLVALAPPAPAHGQVASGRVPAAGGDIIITPLIHASVQIEHAGKVIQVDPWSLGDLSRAKAADLILITDDPGHHLDVKAIGQLRKPGAPVVLTEAAKTRYPDGIIMANGERASEGGITVEAIPAYDIIPGEPSHPKGKSNGYVVTLGGKRIYIAGVTECVPEVRALTHIDVAFIPLNIPLQRMTPSAAAECVKAIAPAIVYPYHYDQVVAAQLTNPRAAAEGPAGGLTVAQSLQAFTDALRGLPIEVREGAWYPARR
jgi:uncharacterized Ntn-hydrolase superfamily protein/L-ascorbate metabolism protein UlaG (beta-lactamase superfamily)